MESSLRRGLAGILAGAARALVPAACAACGRGVGPGPALCGLCEARLPRLPHPRCGRCGEVVGPGRARRRASGVCSACAAWPPELGTVTAPFAFEGVAGRTVRALKYGRWHAVAGPMAAHMAGPAAGLLRDLRLPAAAGADLRAGPVRLVPVPLSPARLRERGFNQAGLLAEELSRKMGLPVAALLARESGGGRQVGRARGQRQRAVQGRFVLRKPAPAPGGAVLLVDDVVTTGATLGACARVLGEAGFHRIAAITFARTLRSRDGAALPASRLATRTRHTR